MLHNTYYLVFLGIYYNQSVWYKITNKTSYGLLLGGMGAFITIIGNVILIPTLGYLGSAIATLVCYFSMSKKLHLKELKIQKRYPNLLVIFFQEMARKSVQKTLES